MPHRSIAVRYNVAMTFQAYLDTIKAKTGKTPEDLKEIAEAAGIYSYDMKAGDLIRFLKEEFDLGHGHSMAVWAAWKQKGYIPTPKTK